MKPREINPECIDDDAWWDIEALKLAVIEPATFRIYVVEGESMSGSTGLHSLGLGSHYRAPNYGDLLIAACKRVSK